MRQSSGSRASVAKTRLSPAVLLGSSPPWRLAMPFARVNVEAAEDSIRRLRQMQCSDRRAGESGALDPTGGVFFYITFMPLALGSPRIYMPSSGTLLARRRPRLAANPAPHHWPRYVARRRTTAPPPIDPGTDRARYGHRDRTFHPDSAVGTICQRPAELVATQVLSQQRDTEASSTHIPSRPAQRRVGFDSIDDGRQLSLFTSRHPINPR